MIPPNFGPPTSPLLETIDTLICTGDLEQAARILAKALRENPRETEALTLLIDVVAVQDGTARALSILEAWEKKTGDRECAATVRERILRDHPGTPESPLDPEDGEAPDQEPGLEANSPGLVEPSETATPEANGLEEETQGIEPASLKSGRFLSLFCGHPSIHARQIPTGPQRGGYHPVHRPLDRTSLQQHLEGEETLGIYLLDPQDRTRLLVFDFDIEKGYLPHLDDPETKGPLLDTMKECVRKVLRILASFGLSPVLEESGYKGYHIWLFLEPQPAGPARLFASQVLDELGPLPPQINIEIFPKQDKAGPKGLSSLVKLPLGIHRKTNQRSTFVDPHRLAPIKAHQALASIVVHPASIIQENTCPPEPHPIRYIQTPASSPTNNPPRPWGDRPRLLPPERASIQIQLLLSGCSVLNRIVEACRKQLSLTRKERHVLVYTLAPLGDEGQGFIHQCLAHLPTYDPDPTSTAIHAVGPTPIGCSRIRKLLPAHSPPETCACPFTLPPETYASPLIHLGLFPRIKTKLPPPGVDHPDSDLTPTGYGYIAHELTRASDPRRLAELKQALQDRLEFLETEMGGSTDDPLQDNRRLATQKASESPDRTAEGTAETQGEKELRSKPRLVILSPNSK